MKKLGQRRGNSLKLPHKLQRIWIRASSPRGAGLPLQDGEFTIERLNSGYFTARKERNKLRMRKLFERKKQSVIATLEEIRIELEQLEEIAERNRPVIGTGLGENLSYEDRRQFIRLMKRIEERQKQHSSFYSYHMQRLRFVAVGWAFVHQFTGEPL